MKVYKITREGKKAALFIDDMNDFNLILGGIEVQEAGARFSIEIIEMDEQEYLELPEFEYFE